VVRCVAVIPARGGSKGVPLKNVAPLAGTTLLDLAIDSARGAAQITDIVVSTDHPTIADRARARDVIVIDRPAALAGDDSPTVDAVRHVIDTLELADDTVIVTLQPTSPLRTHRHVEEALRQFAERSAGTVMSVCEAEHHPLKTFTIDAGNAVTPMRDMTTLESPRQALPRYYRANGAIYVSHAGDIRRHDSVVAPNPHCYVMDRHSSLDVDSPLDMRIAEALLRGELGS
jgi:N-acylneuraminate cytidylyltransferase